MRRKLGKFTLDISITLVTNIIQLALGIGSSIIIARTLGPKGKGIYSLAILLPTLLVSFGNFGFGQASIFFIGRKRYSLNDVFSNNVSLSFLLGTIYVIAGAIIIKFFSNSMFPGIENKFLFLALLLIPVQFFQNFVNSILLGLQRIKEYNLINIIRSFIFLLMLIILLISKFNVETIILANILSCFIGAIILFFIMRKIINNFYVRFNKNYIKDAFKYGFKVYLGNIIQFLHYRIDIFMINIFLTPIAVGFYSVAVGITEKIWLVSQSAGLVLFPKVSAETDKKNLKEFTPIICRNVLLITFVCAILLLFLGKLLIILFYSNKFLDSILPFRILLIGTVIMSGWRILANDIYGRGKPELNIYISFISVILNIVLNILWIPKYGINGAAWATSISYSVAFVLIIIVYSKISKNYLIKIIFINKSDVFLYKNFILSIYSHMFPAKRNI